uniref:SPK domain-containing protein n=2 Tax=Parastrongyloides trichosuri TaxID=131310 RepID=A0A0N4Z8Z2_PARTI
MSLNGNDHENTIKRLVKDKFANCISKINRIAHNRLIMDKAKVGGSTFTPMEIKRLNKIVTSSYIEIIDGPKLRSTKGTCQYFVDVFSNFAKFHPNIKKLISVVNIISATRVAEYRRNTIVDDNGRKVLDNIYGISSSSMSVTELNRILSCKERPGHQEIFKCIIKILSSVKTDVEFQTMMKENIKVLNFIKEYIINIAEAYVLQFITPPNFSLEERFMKAYSEHEELFKKEGYNKNPTTLVIAKHSDVLLSLLFIIGSTLAQVTFDCDYDVIYSDGRVRTRSPNAISEEELPSEYRNYRNRPRRRQKNRKSGPSKRVQIGRHRRVSLTQ